MLNAMNFEWFNSVVVVVANFVSKLSPSCKLRERSGVRVVICCQMVFGCDGLPLVRLLSTTACQ